MMQTHRGGKTGSAEVAFVLLFVCMRSAGASFVAFYVCLGFLASDEHLIRQASDLQIVTDG